MKKNKNAFTLVELLASIVILAILLVIAVPQIINIIEDVRKATFSSTAKIIASEAEKKYVENEVMGIEENINCASISKLSEEDYGYCNISMNDGIALVTLVGTGKFEGMKVLNGTKTNANVVEDNGEELYTLEDVYNMVNDVIAELERVKDTTTGNKNSITELTTRVNDVEETTTNMSILKAYPVGSIYMSENSTSPAELFGGEWVQLKDRFLLGAGDTYTAGSTGGESTTLIKIENLPSAAMVFHYTDVGNWVTGVWGNHLTGTYWASVPLSEYPNDYSSNKPHNNMPPYLTVYMWKRTA